MCMSLGHSSWALNEKTLDRVHFPFIRDLGIAPRGSAKSRRSRYEQVQINRPRIYLFVFWKKLDPSNFVHNGDIDVLNERLWERLARAICLLVGFLNRIEYFDQTMAVESWTFAAVSCQRYSRQARARQSSSHTAWPGAVTAVPATRRLAPPSLRRLLVTSVLIATHRDGLLWWTVRKWQKSTERSRSDAERSYQTTSRHSTAWSTSWSSCRRKTIPDTFDTLTSSFSTSIWLQC